MTTMRVLKEYIAKTLAWIRKEGGLKEWTIDKNLCKGNERLGEVGNRALPQVDVYILRKFVCGNYNSTYL